MRVGDIPAVMEIERRSFPSPWPESAYRYELRYGATSQFYVLQPRESSPSTWRDRLRDALHRQGPPPVLGYVGLRLHGGDAHISTIAVHPDWRGLGLGLLLLLTALEKALLCGALRMTLEVRPSNRVARRLYAKVGFVQTGCRRAYYRDGEDAWIMTLGPLKAADIDRLQDLKRAVEARLAKEERLRGL
jgi:ribosomal-protein-alanine N-acetyltransferase